MAKYQNKYRIESNRMPKWDYSGNGVYFLTIVTQNRVCNLGEILVDATGHTFLQLSDFGRIVETELLRSFEIRNELYLDEYIIMPNHLHAIIVLNKSRNGVHGARGTHVEAHGRAPLHAHTPYQPAEFDKKTFFRKPRSISSFMAGFKSAVNSEIDNYIDDHKLDIPKYDRKNHFFQLNYYDHIIRNRSEYDQIKNYIINNPANWDDDKFRNG